MSQLGQSRHLDRAPLTSGLPRLADIFSVCRHVRKVPQADYLADVAAESGGPCVDADLCSPVVWSSVAPTMFDSARQV
jgi:hypothetical protein